MMSATISIVIYATFLFHSTQFFSVSTAVKHTLFCCWWC